MPNAELFGEYDVERRTRILSRNIAGPDESVHSIGIDVAHKLLKALHLRGKSCGGLVLASSSSPDLLRDALHIAKQLDIHGPAIGVNYACSGFPKAVSEAMYLADAERISQDILIIAAETLSRIVNWEDKKTAILFADRAAATTLMPAGRFQIVHADAKDLEDPENAIRLEHVGKALDECGHRRDRACVVMNGKRVFEFASTRMVELIEETFAQDSSLDINELSTVVMHQANGRIIERAEEELDKRGLGHVRVEKNIERMGNVAAASIPATLAAIQEQIPEDTLVACPALGAGAGIADGRRTEGIIVMRRTV